MYSEITIVFTNIRYDALTVAAFYSLWYYIIFLIGNINVLRMLLPHPPYTVT